MTRIVTDENLAEFLGFAQQVVDVGYGLFSGSYSRGHSNRDPVLNLDDITSRTKYARIYVNNGSQNMVWGFVRLDNGDVLKAESWKKPALNFARGNIFDKAHGLERAPWTGVS